MLGRCRADELMDYDLGGVGLRWTRLQNNGAVRDEDRDPATNREC